MSFPSGPVLREMRDAEYLVWAEKSRASYAADKMKANGYTREEADRIADESFTRLLPHGRKSPDQFFYVLELGGEHLGSLWFALQGVATNRKAFIYDVLIDVSARGKGFGRAIMSLAELEAKRLGAVAIGLHVFAFNTPAVKLYESLAYRVTDLSMEKRLAP